MPVYWSAKDERQYKHILSSCRGSVRRCRRIAAATVNKRRRAEGRTLRGFAAVEPLETRGYKDGRHSWIDVRPKFGPAMRITHTIGANLSRRPSFEAVELTTRPAPPPGYFWSHYCIAQDPFTRRCKLRGFRLQKIPRS